MEAGWKPALFFGGPALAVGAIATNISGYYAVLWLPLGVAVLLGVRLFLHPVEGPLQSGAVGALVGAGPAFFTGLWAWWWSGFCTFDCDGVSNDPMRFVAWFVPVIAAFSLLGFLANRAGQYMEANATVPAPT